MCFHGLSLLVLSGFCQSVQLRRVQRPKETDAKGSTFEPLCETPGNRNVKFFRNFQGKCQLEVQTSTSSTFLRLALNFSSITGFVCFSGFQRVFLLPVECSTDCFNESSVVFFLVKSYEGCLFSFSFVLICMYDYFRFAFYVAIKNPGHCLTGHARIKCNSGPLRRPIVLYIRIYSSVSFHYDSIGLSFCNTLLPFPLFLLSSLCVYDPVTEVIEKEEHTVVPNQSGNEREKMGRAPCCDKDGVRKGAWTPEEDEVLVQYIKKHGCGSWRTLPKHAGLLRCGKSCRLRWINYLRPDIKRGPFTAEEETTIIQLHGMLGNRWAAIASQLPGRTDNEIKNYWNTHLKKRLLRSGHSPMAQKPSFGPDETDIKSGSPAIRHMVQWEKARVEAESRLSMELESSLPNSCSSTNTHPDCFLQLWHSEVGQSFRTIMEKEAVSQSSASQASSAFADMAEEQASSSKPKLGDGNGFAGSESGFYEFIDSSDTALKLLLDMLDGNIGFPEELG